MKDAITTVLIIFGIILVLLGLVGFIPGIHATYGVSPDLYQTTSLFFILGLVFLVIAFLLKQSSGRKRVVMKKRKR